MECPTCGRKNLEDAKFCSGCGINFEELLKCAGCGAELALDDSFCSACGKPVEEPEIRGTLARETSFQEAAKSVPEEPEQTKEDSPEPIKPPTESLPEEPEQPKEEKPKSSTPKSLRALVITVIIIVGLLALLMIVNTLTDDGDSSEKTLTPTQVKESATARRALYAQKTEATARALANKSYSVSHSYFNMSINKKNEFTIWINSIHNRSSRPSYEEWSEQLNLLDDAITSAKEVSPEYMNSAHFEFAFFWNTFFIPSLETSYGYYWKAIDDPSSIEAMNEAGTLLTAHRLNDEWAGWYESNRDTILSNLEREDLLQQLGGSRE